MSTEPRLARVDELIEAATSVRLRAYAPYSHFLVGAAVMAGGQVFAAPNIECASYPLSVCAERNAVAAAVTAGQIKIEAVAVVGTGEKPTPPCGGCRQVLFEFGGQELMVIVASLSGQREVWSLSELLPSAFGPSDLQV